MGVNKWVVEFINEKQLRSISYEGMGVGIQHHCNSSPAHTRVFGLHPVSNGISRRLIEAGRQLHRGAGSLAWEQGVAGLRGIGPSLRVVQWIWHTREL